MGARTPVVKLRPVRHPKAGGNRWCGPAIVSALTGLDTAETAAMFRIVTGRRKITGTHQWEVRTVLTRLGLQVREVAVYSGAGRMQPTLASWHKRWRQDGRFADGVVWLVSAGHHWQAVTARKYVCGRTGDVVSIKDERVKRRARVRAVWQITQ